MTQGKTSQIAAVQESEELVVRGAEEHNLKHVTVSIPKKKLVVFTGVSGSGKSTLVNETLYPAAAVAINKATTLKPAPHTQITGLNLLDKCIDINQSPIGRTPRSNPAHRIHGAVQGRFPCRAESPKNGRPHRATPA